MTFVKIETVEHPSRYSEAQIQRAILITASINRYRTVLLEPPAHPQRLRKAQP